MLNHCTEVADEYFWMHKWSKILES